MPTPVYNTYNQKLKCNKCQRPIFWAKNEKTGKNMPIDVNSIRVEAQHRANGRFTLLVIEKGIIKRMKRGKELVIGEVGHRSHFETCPYAEDFRAPQPQPQSKPENKNQMQLL